MFPVIGTFHSACIYNKRMLDNFISSVRTKLNRVSEQKRQFLVFASCWSVLFYVYAYLKSL